MSHAPDFNKISELRERVRERLTMAEVCAKDGLEGRKEGRALRARCPFHEEKSGSFLIAGRSPHRAHCFGCGWDGDIFDYWADRRGLDRQRDHVEVVNQLASLVGLTPVIPGVKWERPKATALAAVTGNRKIENGEKPALPKMRLLRDGEIEALASLRGLSVEGITVAAHTFKRVGFSQWPLYLSKRENRWMSPCEAHWFQCGFEKPECAPVPRFPCWVVSDEQRWVAQFRRLDGELFQPRGKGDKEAKGFKSWTVGTAKWPIGASEIGNRIGVIFVEGGADMLAAYHFLHHYKRLHDVAVVCMLGGSHIAEAALPYFVGKRVRIIADADELQRKRIPKEDGTERVIETRPGLDNAYRWQEQLTEAGAAVKTFFLDDLVRRDGRPVKDLNDVALCHRTVWESWEIAEAFTQWKEGFGG